MMPSQHRLFVFLSEILNRLVRDAAGVRVGVLDDITMRFSDEVYPRAEGLIIRRGVLSHRFAHVSMDDVERIGDDEIVLKITEQNLRFFHHKKRYDYTLCNDVLDRQVVDIDGHKVVRVNDVHLLKVDNQLYLAHVDIGFRALMRRLGFTPFVDGLVRLVAPKSSYLTADRFIAWKNTQVLTSGRYRNVLKLSVSRRKMAQIPPAELAEIMEDLDVFERLALLRSLDREVRYRVFADLATHEKVEILEHLEDKEAVELLENIPSDEATDVLHALDTNDRLKYLRLMENETSRRLRKLLGFAHDSAGGLMTTEYLSVPPQATVAEAMELVKKSVDYPGNIYHLYIVDDKGRLVGQTSLRRFINAEGSTLLTDTAFPSLVSVKTDDSVEEIALLMEKYRFSSIPVVDEGGVLQGVVTTDDVMEELISLAWHKYKDKLT